MANFQLTLAEQEVLSALWTEILAGGQPVDAPSFRADHDEQLSIIERLTRIRYIHADQNAYRPTLLGLQVMGDQQSSDVLETGSKLLELCRAHYKDRLTRKAPLLLGNIQTKLKLDKQSLLLHLSLLDDVLCLVIGGRTTDMSVPDAYLMPAESVLRYRNMDALLDEMRRWRDNALNSEHLYTHKIEQRPHYPSQHAADDLLRALPPALRDLMAEIRTAAKNGMRSLAVMGLRAVIDAFANEKVGDCGGFEKKITEMVKRNLLNQGQEEMLRAAIEIGHATTHRMYAPTEIQCQQVMSVVEHLLREMYLLHPSTRAMAADVPPRKL